MFVIVGITIIERNAGGARRESPGLQTIDGFRERQDIATGFQKRTDLFKATLVDFAREQWVRTTQHSVKYENGQASAMPPGGEEIEQGAYERW